MTIGAPYYSDEWVTLYHGDCREVPPVLAGDVLITDPPYGFGAYESDRAVLPPLSEWVTEFATVAVFGYPELLVRWCVAEEVVPSEWVTWWPTNPMRGRDAQLQRETEAIAVFGAVPGRPLREQAGATVRYARKYQGSENPRGAATLGDVWRDAKPGMAFQSHLRLHPNEKPLSLMRKLVTLCSETGATVVDPFAGSGTTLRAAKDLGRKAIGIEIEERYCEIAARRLSQEVLALGG